MTHIELLSPARDLECGIAAVNHGADAVYIGGPSFSARAAAGNTLPDIEKLASYAHRYRARVYMTLNTILFDNELQEAESLARGAWDAGADALIIQDVGLLELDLPPLPLIASTQMHNADAGHIRFLEQAGFQRVILARELSLGQISDIRRSTSIELEAFVHGALCVSYSGRCYLSAAIGGRSANRGACGQPCRLPWNLIDAEGRLLQEGRHLLSLKDMDRSAFLTGLIDSGVTAFKIEGRLKDTAYVKNITAFYRRRIDAILEARPDLKRASSGKTEILFTPDPARTFCRGSTPYFTDRDEGDIGSPDTPKSLGERMGTVTGCGNGWFTLGRADEINAGDGLCFFDGKRELKGLQVVRQADGRIYVHKSAPGLKPGMEIFRNHDHQFLKKLSGETSLRRVDLHLTFRETTEGFTLEGRDEDGICEAVTFITAREPAVKPDEAFATIRKQLARLGESMFRPASLSLETKPYFIRTSDLNRMRRELTAALERKRMESYVRPRRMHLPDAEITYPVTGLDYRFNISNKAAADFYRKHGAISISQAFELQPPPAGAVVMTTRHCLRRALGVCPRVNQEARLDEPLFIENAGHRFRLAFDCRNCCMQVIRD